MAHCDVAVLVPADAAEPKKVADMILKPWFGRLWDFRRFIEPPPHPPFMIFVGAKAYSQDDLDQELHGALPLSVEEAARMLSDPSTRAVFANIHC